MDPLEKLVNHGREMGLSIRVDKDIRLIPGRLGEYLPALNEIKIAPQLSDLEKALVLSHEIGHAVDLREDWKRWTDCSSSLDRWNRELRAWRYGIALLRFYRINIPSSILARIIKPGARYWRLKCVIEFLGMETL